MVDHHIIAHTAAVCRGHHLSVVGRQNRTAVGRRQIHTVVKLRYSQCRMDTVPVFVGNPCNPAPRLVEKRFDLEGLGRPQKDVGKKLVDAVLYLAAGTPHLPSAKVLTSPSHSGIVKDVSKLETAYPPGLRQTYEMKESRFLR